MNINIRSTSLINPLIVPCNNFRSSLNLTVIGYFKVTRHWVRPCLPSLILDPSISNNVIRLNLIKLLIKIINFRYLNNAQICSKMPYVELIAGREPLKVFL
jgi:hypothetical protein